MLNYDVGNLLYNMKEKKFTGMYMKYDKL